MTDERTLYEFEGLPVWQVGAEVPGAAGGLREAMKVDRNVTKQGQRKAIILDAFVLKVRHDPIDSSDATGPQRRVEVWAVEGATIVDRDLVAGPLDAQKSRIDAARDEEERQKREQSGHANLDDQLFELAKEHAAGDHADGLVAGCEACDNEQAAVDAEACAPLAVVGSPPAPDWGPRALEAK